MWIPPDPRQGQQLYGDIPNHPIPQHPAINLSPVKPETFTLDSNLPYVLGFISYRMPGTDSPIMRQPKSWRTS